MERIKQTECSQFSLRVVEFGNALAEELIELRRIVYVIESLADSRYTEQHSALRQSTHFLKSNEGDVKNFYSACKQLCPLKSHLPHRRKDEPEHFADRFMNTGVRILSSTLAEQADSVLSLSGAEKAVFDAVISRSDIDVNMTENYLLKGITNVIFRLARDTFDVELELVLHILITDLRYRAQFDHWMSEATFSTIIQDYDSYISAAGLTQEGRQHASQVMEFIYVKLLKGYRSPANYAKAWQLCSEFSKESRAGSAQSVSAMTSCIEQVLIREGKENDYFVFSKDARRIDLQASDLPMSLDVCMHALYAALWAVDPRERFAGINLLQRFLILDNFEELIRSYRTDVYQLLFRKILMMLHRREFEYLMEGEVLKLLQEESPVYQCFQTKSRPIDMPEIDSALFNQIFFREKIDILTPLSPQFERSTFTKALVEVMGESQFIHWFTTLNEFRSSSHV